MTLTRDQIIDLFAEMNVMPMETMIGDSTFALPAREYLRDVFGPDFWTYLGQWGLRGYIPRRNDCGTFALNAACYAANLHARTPGAEVGLAFGIFWYHPDNSETRHAINFALVNDEGRPAVVFLEPQLACSDRPPETLEVKLSTTEIESCSGLCLLA